MMSNVMESFPENDSDGDKGMEWRLGWDRLGLEMLGD